MARGHGGWCRAGILSLLGLMVPARAWAQTQLVSVSTETDVHHNTMSQHLDDAMEPEGYCSNVRLFENRIKDVHMAFAVAPANPGPTYIVRNVAYNFGNTRASQTDGYLASALKINSGFTETVGPLFLLHNTFLTQAPGTDAVALLNPGLSTYIVARNNVFAGTRYALYKVNPVALDWMGDDLYTTDPTRFDTRGPAGPLGGPQIFPSAQRVFPVAGVCGVPLTAKALVVNATVVGPAASGHIRLFPGNEAPPLASLNNFAVGKTRAGIAVVRLATDGSGSIGLLNGSAGTMHFVLDVSGYFQ